MRTKTPQGGKGGGGFDRGSFGKRDISNTIKVDDKDHQIISILRENSRESVRDIAKKTGIRPSTVHIRIQKMIQENVIEKFTLKLNNKAIGENFIVFMLVKTSVMIDEKKFHKPQIKEVFGITGEYDLMIKLKFKDIEEFNDFVINFREENKVAVTVTMVSTAVIKEEI